VIDVEQRGSAVAPKRGSAEARLSSILADYFQEELDHARTVGSVGFYARVLTQATLPHSDPKVPIFERRNGSLSLSMAAPPSVGLPYGSIPRLLLAWVTTEAVRTKSRELVLGDHLSGFMRQLRIIPTGGRWGTIGRLRAQMERLFSTSVWVRYNGDNISAGTGWMVADDYQLWWDPKRPDEPVLWESTITLGEHFYREIIERPVPVSMEALQRLRKSPLALDLYMWLTYRMSYLRTSTRIPWSALHLQLGADYTNVWHFKPEVIQALHKIVDIYPVVVEASKDGLILRPSPTHIPPRAQ
jgi:hypothetical protein